MNNDPFGVPVPGAAPAPQPTPQPTPQPEPVAPVNPDNPFSTPAAQPFAQPTAAVPADLAQAAPVSTPEPAPEPMPAAPAPEPMPTAPAPEPMPTPATPTVAEADPAPAPIVGSAAPVASPADPGSPTAVPTVVGDNHVPEANPKKNTRLIVGILAGVIVLVILILFLTFTVFGRKTLSCEKSEDAYGVNTADKVEASFLFDKVQSIKFSETVIIEDGISDEQIESAKDQLSDDEDYTNVKVSRINENTAEISAELKKSAIKGDDTSYEDAKSYLKEVGYTCKD